MRRFYVAVVLTIALLWAAASYATVSNLNLKSGPYATDGNATVFSITFQYLEDLDIVVQLLNISTGSTITLVQNSDYTVTDGTPAADDGTLPGGSITILPNAEGIANGSGQIPAGYTLTITRGIALEQGQSYPESGVFPSAATEQALDRLTLITQQQQNTLNNTIQFPSTDSGTSSVLPSAATRAGKYLAFTSSGDVTVSTGTGGVSTVAGTSPIAVSMSGSDATVALTGVVSAATGGTGRSTLTSNSLLAGNGTSAVNLVAVGAVNSCLISNGSSWAAGSCSGTSNMTLGSSTTANPQISGDVLSGFYSSAAAKVDVEASGVHAMQWGTLSSGVDYITVTPGKSGTAPNISVNGNTANQSLGLTATGTGHVGISGISQPTSVATNQVYQASSSSALAPVSVSTMIDNGIGSTAGSILYRTSTSWQPLADSTSGYVLTANGAGVAPSYQASAASNVGATLLATVNASAASAVVFNSTYITSTYNKYLIEFDGVYTSDGGNLQPTFSSNNGGAYSVFGGTDIYINSSNTVVVANDGGLLTDPGTETTADAAVSGTARFNIGSATVAQTIIAESSILASSGSAVGFLVKSTGQMALGAAGNNLKITDLLGGTITGNFHLYGLKGT